MSISPKLYYFEDFSEGDVQKSITFTVEKQQAIEFAKTWDPQPFHIDETAAAASHFGGLTCCSAQIFSIYCTLAQSWEDGGVQQAIASLGFDEMRMRKPVYAGDHLRCVTEVEDKRESKSNAAGGICVCRVELINQHDEVVFSIKASTMMMKDPARNKIEN